MLKLNQISVLVDINPNTGPSNDTLVGMPPYYINDNLAKWAITLDSENGSIDKEGRTTSTLFWQDVGPSPDLMFSGKWLRLRAGSNFGASFSSLEHWGKWFVTNNSKLKFGFMLTEGGSYVAPSVVNPAIPRVKNIQVLNSSHVATYGYVMNFSIVKIPKFKYTR